MQFFNVLIALLVGGFFIWRFIALYKSQPEMFSKENFGKSFYTIGVLGVILFAAIYFVIALLNS